MTPNNRTRPTPGLGRRSPGSSARPSRGVVLRRRRPSQLGHLPPRAHYDLVDRVRRTDDLRIQTIRPLIPPAILSEEIPLTPRVAEVVSGGRDAIGRILRGEDRRILAVVGPCSIHDTAAALEYGEGLQRLAQRYEDDLLIVMRAYFEKPRTTVGWKGLINDPDLDESFHVNKGLRLARRLLSDLAEMGLPCGTEFLDMITPQHIAEMVAWGAIGARTTESQTHRELASGLSMPVGFKNNTDGSWKAAVDAIVSARTSHWFPSITKQGVAAFFQTTGNECCHVILRGGSKTGPNYDREHVKQVAEKLRALDLPARVMIDCSHANSSKDHRRQCVVLEDICRQLQEGERAIMGVMIESNLVSGRQDYIPGKDPVYGQSITDACIDLEETGRLMEQLARAASR